MFKWFKWNRSKESINARLAKLEEKLESEQQEKQQAVEELTILRSKLDQYEEKRNGTEPWIEIVGENIDPVRGIHLQLDWNDAFIQYLKENGISAKDEDAAIQKWLALLYHNLVNSLEQQIIENSDKPEHLTSEFQ